MTTELPPGRPGRIARFGWRCLGLLAVGLGGLGILVPGLPTTVFFIMATWCFSKSSPRLERWVLGLPRIGPMVRDYRDGLGMPRRAKAVAVAMIVVAITLSAFAIAHPTGIAALLVAGAVGIAVIVWRVPTRAAATVPSGAE